MPIQNRFDRRTPGTDTWGVPDITWEEDSQAHPTILETLTIPATQAQRAFLSTHPNAGAYPNAYLVHKKTSKGNNRDQNIWYTYMTLPGPWIYDRILGPNGIVTETKKRNTLPSTFPTGGTGITRDEVQQLSVTLAVESIISYTDGAGALVAPPIYDSEEADPETNYASTIHTYRQEQSGSSPAFPVVDSVYGTAKLLGDGASSGINSALVDAPGSGYTSLPTVAPTATGGGSGATLVAASLKAVSAALQTSAAVIPGAVITFSGGTFSSAATATAGNSSLATIAVNANGSGYTFGEVITLAGGTVADVEFNTTTYYYLLVNSSTTSITPGTGYQVGDFITMSSTGLSPGSSPAVFQVTDLTFSGGGVRSYAYVGTPTNSLYTSQLPSVAQASTTGIGTGFGIYNPSWYPYTQTTPTQPGRAQVTVTGGGVSSVTPVAPGSGYKLDPGFPATTTEITLAGGTFTTAAKVKPTRVSVQSGDIDDGGTGYAVGDLITLGGFVGGTVYTAGVAEVLTVDMSGVVLTFEITVNGSYSTSELDVTQSATTGSGTGFGLVGISWGIAEATVSLAGDYTATASPFTQGSSTTMSASGATFTALFTVTAVTISAPGSYSVSSATFTQYSSSGSGTGVTFNSATFQLLSLTLLSAGVYTVPPSNPVSGTGGVTANLSFGLNAITVTAPGSSYGAGNRTLTVTGGGGTGARAHGVVLPSGWREVDAWIVNGRMEDQPNSPKKMKVWVTMPVPDVRKEYVQIPFPWPAIITILTNFSPFSRPAPGTDFNLRPEHRAVYPALNTITYYHGMPSDIPAVFQVISPAASSRYFPITTNTIHPAFFWATYTVETDGSVVLNNPETFVASTPFPYTIGQIVIVRVIPRNVRGNIWALEIATLSEDGPLY